MTKDADIFVEKPREIFAVQKLFTLFSTKISAYFSYKHLKYYETLTNADVSFEQPGPDCYVLINERVLIPCCCCCCVVVLLLYNVHVKSYGHVGTVS